MVKKLFIDLDNTIIKNKPADIECYKKVLKEFGFDEGDYQRLYNTIDEYEHSLTEDNPYYNLKEMVDFINNALGKSYPYALAERLGEVVEVEWAKKENILIPEEIMEYLYAKYDLYVYTNFFQDIQTKRIENMGYRKYFKGIFGADIYGVKPFRSCFNRALKEIYNNNELNEIEYKKELEEIVYIGDYIKSDIYFAKNIGIKSVLFDEYGSKDVFRGKIDEYEYYIIHKWDEITKIL